MLVAKALLGGIRRDGGYTLTPFFKDLHGNPYCFLYFILWPMSVFEVLMIARRRYLGATNALEAIYTSPDSEIGPC